MLEGTRVRMEPLALALHWDGLLAIGLDPDLWKYTLSIVQTPDDLKRYLDDALGEQVRGVSLPFATIDVASGKVAGCTRFGNIDRRSRHVEIGWTFVGRPFIRSYVNTEAKYLMMRQAFETWGCVRVELKTGAQNKRSQEAMKRIGCIEEGTLRKRGINDRGEVRDTVYFSVIDTEWPAVKSRLEGMMTRNA